MSKGFLDEKDKKAMLEKELNAAIEGSQEKVASFRGNMQNPYPSPFLNLSDMQLPESTIDVFKWCKYYYTFDPLISGAINALATFPVSEVTLEDDENKSKEKSDSVKLYEKVLFKNLNLHKLLIEIGIDYFLYGNCFVMGELGGNSKGEKEWTNMIRLDPSKMIIDYNPATGSKTFRWTIPQKIRDIVTKKQPKAEYEKIPELMKQAVRKNKSIILNPDNVYHFSRATDSMGDNSVWGVPVVANVLKLLMYRNVLRQAQEAIAREHIVPMRIYYLDRTNTVNIQADWNKTAQDLADQIKKSVRDPNYKVVSPVPVNVINVGGEGRSLLLAPEIDQVQSEILAGMNMPKEFIFGGVSYSGSSISLRILENQFITYRLLLEDFMQNFIIRGMAKARGEWLSEEDDDALLSVKMSDLKMQDDVQQKQLIIQLNSANKCSNDYMWKAMGMDSDKMKEAIEKETMDALLLQTKAENEKIKMQIESMELQEQLQIKQMEMQFKLQAMQQKLAQQYGVNINPEEQQAPQSGGTGEQQATNQQAGESKQSQQPQEGQQNNGDVEKEVNRIALSLIKMPKEQQTQYLSKIPMEAKGMVEKRLAELEQTKQTKQSKDKIDMRPLPNQKPPRRES